MTQSTPEKTWRYVRPSGEENFTQEVKSAVNSEIPVNRDYLKLLLILDALNCCMSADLDGKDLQELKDDLNLTSPMLFDVQYALDFIIDYTGDIIFEGTYGFTRSNKDGEVVDFIAFKVGDAHTIPILDEDSRNILEAVSKNPNVFPSFLAETPNNKKINVFEVDLNSWEVKKSTYAV